MRKIIFLLVFFGWLVNGHSQNQFSGVIEEIQNTTDSAYFQMDLSISMKGAQEASIIPAYKNQGIAGGRTSKKILMFPGVYWSWTAYPFVLKKWRYQPHIFLDFRAFFKPSSYSYKLGLGYTDTHDRYSLGFLVGGYEKIVPYKADILTRRQKNFEIGSSYGVYLAVDLDHIFFAGQYMSHKKNREGGRGAYYSLRFDHRIGRLVNPHGFLETLKIGVVSESFYGTGPSLSMDFSLKENPRIRVTTSYQMPSRKETQVANRLDVNIGNGYNFNIQLRF